MKGRERDEVEVEVNEEWVVKVVVNGRIRTHKVAFYDIKSTLIFPPYSKAWKNLRKINEIYCGI